MIQPIETYYAGCRFRSRLEARWAVFFDCLGIAWEYEPEGYALDEETWYLPDFCLPIFDGGMYCEVKPLGGDFTLAERFSIGMGVKMWLCEDVPDFRPYTVIFPTWSTHKIVDGQWVKDRYPTYVQCAPCYAQAYQEHRMFTDLDPHEITRFQAESSPWYIHAIEQARGSRFEREDKGIRYKPLPENQLW